MPSRHRDHAIRIRTREPHRRRAAGRGGARGGPHGRRGPLPRRDRLRPVRGTLSYPTAQADLRRLRRRGRRPHPRPFDQDRRAEAAGWAGCARTRPFHGSDPMTNDEIRGFIENAIKENGVMLLMKGTQHQPACGFSARTAGALNALGVQYAALDILPDPRIREELSGLSGWPTIPQLFVDGELIGGCDIVMEMYESGELAEKLHVDMPGEEAEGPPGPETRKAPPIGLENRLE